jgi:hypothetical protein
MLHLSLNIFIIFILLDLVRLFLLYVDWSGLGVIEVDFDLI